MDQMDERQQQVRGHIAMKALIGVVVYMVLAIIVTEFGIFDIEHTFGFSAFLMGSLIVLIWYMSIMFLIKDAYFGLGMGSQYRACRVVFTLLAVLQDGVCIFDILHGEGFSFISVMTLCYVNSVAICLWLRRKEWMK